MLNHDRLQEKQHMHELCSARASLSPTFCRACCLWLVFSWIASFRDLALTWLRAVEGAMLFFFLRCWSFSVSSPDSPLLAFPKTKAFFYSKQTKQNHSRSKGLQGRCHLNILQHFCDSPYSISTVITLFPYKPVLSHYFSPPRITRPPGHRCITAVATIFFHYELKRVSPSCSQLATISVFFFNFLCYQ